MLLLMLLFQSTEFAHKTTHPCFIYYDNYDFYHLHIPFFNPAQCLNVLHTPQLFVPIMDRLPNTLYLCCQWLCSAHTHTGNSTYGDSCVCTFTHALQIFMKCHMTIQVVTMCHKLSSYKRYEDCTD